MTSDLKDIPGKDASCEEWNEWGRRRLSKFAGEISINPMTNSVQRLAHEMFMALEQGEVSLDILNNLKNSIGHNALLARADRFREAHQLSAAGPAHQLLNQPEDFSAFKEKVETTRAGIVFTGHPTFAISKKLRSDFIAYVEADNDDDRQNMATVLRNNLHRPDEAITIMSEHNEVQNSITNAISALNKINNDILEVAKENYPSQWHQLCPMPLSVASWVGYDLDGRTDIHWAQTLTIRLHEKTRQLQNYKRELLAIRSLSDNALAIEIVDTLDRAAVLTKQQADLFSGDLEDPDIVTEAANRLTEDHPDRLVSLVSVVEKIGTLIECAENDDSRMALCLLRAQMKACGLGLARIHLRVNAAQVRSVLRHDFGVQSDTDFMGRSTLDMAAREAGSIDTYNVNFASVFLEKMTARRQFMLCAQILKHIDADTPIRFLIAECEAPATIMGAVYLARAYGVADMLDISPLFETPEALERGGRFLERLLQEEEYQRYIKVRKRISIQLGFSDSGRFMGQIAADMAIERLHILLARTLAGHQLTNIEALVFNTNGESMGRGGFPGEIEDRLHHLITPWTRSKYARENIHLNAESAFQGGEGFLHFLTPDIARRTMSEVFRVSFTDWKPDHDDMFYKDINFSWDFYRGVKAWQENLFENEDYTKAISSFGQKFLFTTGSRKTRRQRKGAADMSPRALRAIPHNAILQQMAIPANVACGIGTAVYQEADRFVTIVTHSDRLQRLVSMAQTARKLTSLPAFLGYANIHNASYWVRQATSCNDKEKSDAYFVIATQLADQNVYTALCRLANEFAVDLAGFDAILQAIHGKEQVNARHEERLNLHILHSLRQSVIMYALVLIARLPAFSGRHEVSQSDLVDMVLHLQFDEVIQVLGTIFPVQRPEVEALAGIKEPTSLDQSMQSGYPHIHQNIVQPLQEIQTIIQETGIAISHFYGAYG